MSKHSEKAKSLFHEGYNCAQAVFAAFCDETGLDFETALRLSSSFGGGMGRLREVCGAVSGMLMAAGMIFGYSDPKDKAAKAEHYALVQALAKRFEVENGSIICRELLGLSVKKESPALEERTESYYKKRPCADLVACAAEILDDYLESSHTVAGKGQEAR
ncbi:MAG: C-GCAxxG-C-C family protein [Oscillospiraceae bacterium]|nr:C-GCAxxG-C-C family protein [Oscillospiraceae bacterium]